MSKNVGQLIIILSISIILAKMKISYEFTPTFWGAKSLGLPVVNVLWILQKLLKSCSLPLFSRLMQKICKLYNKSKISKHFRAILQHNQEPITHT